jgi:hypothetical protein
MQHALQRVVGLMQRSTKGLFLFLISVILAITFFYLTILNPNQPWTWIFTFLGILAIILQILGISIKDIISRPDQERQIIEGSSNIYENALELFDEANDEILIWAKTACLGKVSYPDFMDKSIECFRSAIARDVKIRALFDIYSHASVECVKRFISPGIAIRHSSEKPSFFIAIDGIKALQTYSKITTRVERILPIGDHAYLLPKFWTKNLVEEFNEAWNSATEAEKRIKELSNQKKSNIQC